MFYQLFLGSAVARSVGIGNAISKAINIKRCDEAFPAGLWGKTQKQTTQKEVKNSSRCGNQKSRRTVWSNQSILQS